MREIDIFYKDLSGNIRCETVESTALVKFVNLMGLTATGRGSFLKMAFSQFPPSTNLAILWKNRHPPESNFHPPARLFSTQGEPFSCPLAGGCPSLARLCGTTRLPLLLHYQPAPRQP